MHRVDTEDDRDVQPRVADREVLHGVVLVGPIKAGVAGAAPAGRGDRNVASAGQDRAGVVVDEYLLLTNGVGQVEATLAGTAVGRVGDLRNLDLDHLADLLRQSHSFQQVVDPVLDRSMRVQVRGLLAGRSCRRHRQHGDERGARKSRLARSHAYAAGSGAVAKCPLHVSPPSNLPPQAC